MGWGFYPAHGQHQRKGKELVLVGETGQSYGQFGNGTVIEFHSIEAVR